MACVGECDLVDVDGGLPVVGGHDELGACVFGAEAGSACPAEQVGDGRSGHDEVSRARRATRVFDRPDVAVNWTRNK